MEKSHFRKFVKYRKNGIHSISGWTVIPLCVEVGARDHSAHSWQQMRMSLNFKRAKNRARRKRVNNIARRFSYFIWLNESVKSGAILS